MPHQLLILFYIERERFVYNILYFLHFKIIFDLTFFFLICRTSSSFLFYRKRKETNPHLLMLYLSASHSNSSLITNDNTFQEDKKKNKLIIIEMKTSISKRFIGKLVSNQYHFYFLIYEEVLRVYSNF